ncbi:MAG: ARPP-1 family domain-containing protein [Verrucomicrobiota bacterium]
MRQCGGGETIVVDHPVVCSEPGRWSYPGRGVGPAMGDSGVCLPLGFRAAMRAAGHGAQAMVRRGLMGWRSRSGMGGTMAGWQEREMRRWEGLEKAIAWVPGQVGWMAWVQGAWQSVEVVSRMAAWRRWHGKALRCVLAGADPRGAHHGWDMPGTSMGGARRPDGCWMNWPLGTGHAARA